MKYLLVSLTLCVAHLSHAQFVVATKVAGASGTQIALTDDLVVNSDEADLSKISFILAGATQDLRMSVSNNIVVLGGLIVGDAAGGNGGTKNFFDGSWEVNGTMEFNDGLVILQGTNGKLVHTQANALAGSILVNNPDSYVRGTFYSRGEGTRFFPIGNSSGYFPAQLSSVTQGGIELGMSVVNSSANFVTDTEIPEIFTGQHWVLEDQSQSLKDAFVSISTLGASNFIDPNTGSVVVGGTTVGGDRISLQGALSDNFVVSGKKISINERIFTVGKVGRDQVGVKIRNVITPFRDNANDFLEIENIQLFPDNKVMMLDRWGVQVREWAGFTNFDGTERPDYDLSKLATGNYIVIVEYKDGTSLKKLSQMVTLINQ